MNYNNPQQKTTAPTTVIVCAVVFFLFTFLWLFLFQGDLLAVAQHILSNGQTHYNHLVGAILITVILFVVQQGVNAVARPRHGGHALTYFPSLLLLAVLSSMQTDDGGHIVLGISLWVVALLLLVWVVCVLLERQLSLFENGSHSSSGLFSQQSWANVLLLCVMMLTTAAIANTNAVYHYRAHAEVALKKGDVDEALRVGSRSQETDENLTMLRIYALSRQGLLADSLFSYAIAGTGSDILPLADSRSRLLYLEADSIWAHLGSVRPAAETTFSQYLDSLAVDTLATGAHADYRLTALLIDCRLDSFVVALPDYYVLHPDTLPRHYREALVLYDQMAADSVGRCLGYSDSVMQSRWLEWTELEQQYPDPREMTVRLSKAQRQTYWHYFLLKKRHAL